jgi:hypothetical protein
MKGGKKLKLSVTAKLIYGSEAISAKKITYNTHSKQDGIVQLYFIRNLERSPSIKFDFFLGNLIDNAYFFAWISHKTLFCWQQWFFLYLQTVKFETVSSPNDDCLRMHATDA